MGRRPTCRVSTRGLFANQGSLSITGVESLNVPTIRRAASPLRATARAQASLYIPNPQTGTFDNFGQFRQPWDSISACRCRTIFATCLQAMRS